MCHSLRLQAGLKDPKRREGGSGLHLFWNRLITKAHRLELSGHRKINPSGGKQLWVNSSTSGLRYAYTLGEYQSAVELWIDTGSFDQNKQIFSSLSRNGRRLNAAWAYVPLRWQRLESQRPSRISWSLREDGWKSKQGREQLQDQLIHMMKQFSGVMDSRLSMAG